MSSFMLASRSKAEHEIHGIPASTVPKDRYTAHVPMSSELSNLYDSIVHEDYICLRDARAVMASRQRSICNVQRSGFRSSGLKLGASFSSLMVISQNNLDHWIGYSWCAAKILGSCWLCTYSQV
ncbi:hypothetical protein HGRIS_010715 [Hohenbuehelia grisea]|uniref:Uncharacterized protein n=2 Tax=Hohenbuehelia grisea TaxID=104357 RepID=A0ABR3IXQ9_9AGAR